MWVFRMQTMGLGHCHPLWPPGLIHVLDAGLGTPCWGGVLLQELTVVTAPSLCPGWRDRSSPLPQPPGKRQRLGRGQLSCSIPAWRMAKSLHCWQGPCCPQPGWRERSPAHCAALYILVGFSEHLQNPQ